MESLAKLSFFATNLLMLSIGSRLILAWIRTRQMPELSIGLAYTLGTLGIAGLVVSSELARSGQENFLLWFAAQCLILASQSALVLGVWKIFRPMAFWATVAAMIGFLLNASGIGTAVWRSHPELFVELNPHNVITTLAALYSFAWLTFESLRYASLLKRRQRLGLANALHQSRFLCWGMGGIAAGMVAPLSLLSAAVYRVDLVQVNWIFLLTQLLLVVSSISTWLAFFPPAFYCRWVYGGEEHASV